MREAPRRVSDELATCCQQHVAEQHVSDVRLQERLTRTASEEKAKRAHVQSERESAASAT